MPLLNDEITEQVTQELADLAGPVKIVVFTQESDCQYCAETQQLAEEIAALSDQVMVEAYDLAADREKAEALSVDKVPAIAITGAEDYNVRFYGIPSGYEFGSFIHTIKLVASGKPELSQETLDVLAGLSEPVHMQVFITPT